MNTNELRDYLEQFVAVEGSLLELRAAYESLKLHSLYYKAIGTKADYSIKAIQESLLAQEIATPKKWLNYRSVSRPKELADENLGSFSNYFAFSQKNSDTVLEEIQDLDDALKANLFIENYQAPAKMQTSAPVVKVIKEPVPVAKVRHWGVLKSLIISLIVGLLCIGAIYLAAGKTTQDYSILMYGFLIMSGVTFLGLLGMSVSINKQAKKYDAYLAQKNAYDEYKRQKEEGLTTLKTAFNLACNQAMQKASEAYETFTTERNRIIENEIEKLEKLIHESEELQRALNMQNILHPKYRTLIAANTLLEYIETGRCTELAGPHGAYNLYESELRQNLIIMKIDVVIRKLDELKATMYRCCAAIEKVGKQMDRIHDELRTLNATAVCTQQLTALSLTYAAATAANTEANKYLALIR